MKLGGIFTRGDGLEIPNNITDLGVDFILETLFRNTANATFSFGLTNILFSRTIVAGNVAEPVSNGYARQILNRNTVDWPTLETVDDRRRMVSRSFSFNATGNYSMLVNRIVVFNAAGAPIILSEPFSAGPLQITPATPLPQRTFTYSFYGS